jgi:acyl-CoA oxidase
MSRSEKLANGLSLTKKLFDLVDANDLDYLEFLEGLSALDEPIGLYLHEVAFLPVINAQGSDEQQAYWLPLVQSHAILGCYAQTELAHGSNVQRLGTIATYDHDTKQFDLHTPDIASTKWWIGGLGIMATHSTVQARLIIKGVDYGPHLFITQSTYFNPRYPYLTNNHDCCQFDRSKIILLCLIFSLEKLVPRP